MRAGGSKQKGGAFERQTCKALSLWISHGRREDLLWRSAMSGGRATVQAKRGIDNRTQVADISAIHPDGDKLMALFFIECKHVRSLDIAQAIIKRSGFLVKTWTIMQNMVERERAKTGRGNAASPMLIARQNGMRTIMCITRHGRTRLLGIDFNLAEHPAFLANVPTLNMLIYDFEEFMKVPCRL